MPFRTLDDIRALCRDLPPGDASADAAAVDRQAQLTKPPGSLGRLEELAAWMARWQGCSIPTLDRSLITVFAGNHGVAGRAVSAYPQAVTAQMVANFAAGGAAINQIAKAAGAELRIVPIDLDRPTGDFCVAPAMETDDFLAAFDIGYRTVPRGIQLLAVGEMGIANTTAASALCAALIDGDAARWTGRGTGIDQAGVARKTRVVAEGLRRHGAALRDDPLAVAAALGGRELAAVAGAVVAARLHKIPVLLDGFVATAAVLPLVRLDPAILDHCRAGHVSSEAGHRHLLHELRLRPLLDLDMRLGEASGAGVAILLVRAALACHAGMATFPEAGVSGASSQQRPTRAVTARP